MDRKDRQHSRAMLDAWSLAFMFPLAIAIGALWGYGMDKWFGTYPWLTVIFTIFGVAAAFLNFFRIALKDDSGSGKSDGSLRK